MSQLATISEEERRDTEPDVELADHNNPIDVEIQSIRPENLAPFQPTITEAETTDSIQLANRSFVVEGVTVFSRASEFLNRHHLALNCVLCCFTVSTATLFLMTVFQFINNFANIA